jgi:hypothetical protein
VVAAVGLATATDWISTDRRSARRSPQDLPGRAADDAAPDLADDEAVDVLDDVADRREIRTS